MKNILRTTVLALPLVLLNMGCILVPEIEDRVVELAVGASTTATFVASGELNTHSDTDVIDLDTDIDLAQVLDDNGVDASDLKAIKLAGVSYRIVQAEAGRSITGGTVTIQRGSNPSQSLVTSFNANCGSTTGWITVPLNAAGVGVVNGILTDLLNKVKNGTPLPSSAVVTYTVNGNSVPASTPTNFKWEFKLEVSMVGTVSVQVVN